MTLNFLQGMVLVFNLLVPATLVAVVAWAAWNANKLGKNALIWGVAAGTGFFIPHRLLKALITKMQEGIVQSADNLTSLVVAYHVPPILAGALVGFLVTWLLTKRFGE